MPFDGLVCSISSSYNGKFLYQVGILRSYSGPDYPGWQTNIAFTCGSCWPLLVFSSFVLFLYSLGDCKFF